ncbi:very long chain fatty acid elongase 7-like [Planococcus citri]|uniref:very long chain fatty acid elongase 7-like n=1 Tax=Planococcus citri TaxID=170843 RepID=UPI0031F8696C
MAPFSIWLDELDEIFDNMADEKTASWPFMQSARTVILIALCYILIVTSIGPKLMENRKPYNLKGIIIVYNTFQVVACTILFAWVILSGPTLGCVPLSVTRAEENLDTARICWWTLLLKLAELLETVFFVMRKKQNQVSALHVYHHVSTFFCTWGCTKIFPSKMVTLPIMLNCFVHMLMYTYYLLSAFGPSIQDKISKWKKYLTIIQMVQFCILLVHTSQTFLPNCEVPSIYPYVFIPNVFLVFYMFYQFYQEAYLKRKQNIK